LHLGVLALGQDLGRVARQYHDDVGGAVDECRLRLLHVGRCANDDEVLGEFLGRYRQRGPGALPRRRHQHGARLGSADVLPFTE